MGQGDHIWVFIADAFLFGLMSIECFRMCSRLVEILRSEPPPEWSGLWPNFLEMRNNKFYYLLRVTNIIKINCFFNVHTKQTTPPKQTMAKNDL